MNKRASLTSRIFEIVKTFDIVKKVSDWWRNETPAAKAAFISGLIICFATHLFVFTGRYYGRDDNSVIYYVMHGPVLTGRWIHLSSLSYYYVLPIVSGLFVSLFLATASFFTCKIFDIKKTFNAVVIAGLLTTFPSIANTNLFLYETVTYHFAVMAGVLAVYITVRYKFGFIAGSIFAMMTLAVYQSKFNVVLALSLLYIILKLLDNSIELKDVLKKHTAKLVIMIILATIIYVLSLLFFSVFYNAQIFSGYRGFSTESMSEKLFTVSGFTNALKTTYIEFNDAFFRTIFNHLYLMVRELKIAYVLIFALSVLFGAVIIKTNKIYKQPLRLVFIIILCALIPLACHFSGFLDANPAYGLTIYAFSTALVFAVVLSEKCINVYPIFKTGFALCIVFVICNFVVGNNAYYMKAYYYNQRTYSLTTRLLARAETLLPQTTSNQITFFGILPNEYYPESREVFREYLPYNDGSSLWDTSFFIHRMAVDKEFNMLAYNIERLHGVRVNPLLRGAEYDAIAKEIIDRTMPVWPAEGSVDVINGVVAINFGITGVVIEEDEDGSYFRAGHFKGGGERDHEYEYDWRVYENGKEVLEYNDVGFDRIYYDMSDSDITYTAAVRVKNVTTGYEYPMVNMYSIVGNIWETTVNR